MDPVSIGLAVAGWLIGKLIAVLVDEAMEKWAKLVHLGDEVASLKKKLHEIAILLDTAHRSNLTNRPLLQSITDLQQAAYDTEDLFDELDYYRLQDMVEQKCDHQTHVSEPAPHKAIIAWRDVLSNVKCNSNRSCMVIPKPLIPKFVKNDLSKRIKDIIENLNQHGEVVRTALSLEHLGRIAETFSLENLGEFTMKLSNKTKNKKLAGISGGNENITVDSASIIERKKVKEGIVTLLKSDNSGDGNIWVLPIVGIGGSGKTTLAKLVYNDKEVIECFSKRSWITVSPSMDKKFLTQNIMSIISNDEVGDGKDGDFDEQLAIIHGKLASEKRLFVVDNLCAEDTYDDRWNCIIKLFRGTKENGTKIMVTTRYPAFANKIFTKGPINLGPLKGNELEELFDACAFQDKKAKDYPSLRGLRKDFVKKLHGYPLEVKTIGAVLSKKLDVEHWKDVLNSDEWMNPNGKDDSEHIMSSVKISYLYLPSDLQKCVTYCSLFPKNFKFEGNDLINLWMAQGFIYSKSGYKSKILGLNSLSELIGRGFFGEVKENAKYQKAPTTFRMHELVYDLAKLISSEEFLTIDGSDVETISKSIRHVSIITHSAYECDNNNKEVEKTFMNKMAKIVEKLDIAKLRTLILIGNYDSNFATTFQNLFKEAKYLRVLRLPMKSDVTDSLLCNFSNSLLLRYLKLVQNSNRSSDKKENKSKENKSDNGKFQKLMFRPYHLLTNSSSDKKQNRSDNDKFHKLMFQLYHLETLDISDWHGEFNIPGITGKLIRLRRLYAKGTQVTEISEIGKLTDLEELPEFMAQREKDFDISQLGELTNLGGSLSICDLECINSKEDAFKAKLLDKRELHDLSLSWSSSASCPPPDSEAILNCLEPPPNIRNLNIHEYPGAKPPSWMVKYRSLNSLRSLILINCNNLDTLPPLGQLPVLERLILKGMPKVKKVTAKFYGPYSKKAFMSLREMVFSDMSSWDEWVGINDCKTFPFLKKLEILCCSNLRKLPEFSNSCFSSLEELKIVSCPKLTVPPLPHSQTLNNISISNVSAPLKKLSLSQSPNGLSLSIEWMIENAALNENVLIFSNLKALVELTIKGCSINCSLWKDFQELVALKRLMIKDLVQNTKNKEMWVLPRSLQLLEISSEYVTGRHVSGWLLNLPHLLTLVIKLPDINSLEVENRETISEDGSTKDEAKLRISPFSLRSLKEISIIQCEKLVSLFLPQNGLRGFSSLEKLTIRNCSKLRSLQVANKKSAEISTLPLASKKSDEISILPVTNEKPDDNFHTSIEDGFSKDEAKLRISPFSLRSLKESSIIQCEKLVSLFLPQNGLRGFSSLEKFTIRKCPKLRSLQVADKKSAEISTLPLTNKNSDEISVISVANEEADDNSILPPTLLQLEIDWLPESMQFQLLSNLTRLTHLKLDSIGNWKSLSLDHFVELQELNIENCIAMSSLKGVGKLGSLTVLKILKCPKFPKAWEEALEKEKEINAKFSLGLKELIIDDTSFLTTGICKYLSALKKMVLDNVEVTELTEVQKKSLFMLSIQQINFRNCSKLQSLPNNLYELEELHTLEIRKCPEIKSLLDDQLPDSIEVFVDESNSQLVECCKKLKKIKMLDIS